MLNRGSRDDGAGDGSGKRPHPSSVHQDEMTGGISGAVASLGLRHHAWHKHSDFHNAYVISLRNSHPARALFSVFFPAAEPVTTLASAELHK